MAKQSKPQKETVERVMHEHKHGQLKRPDGKKVKNRKQAMAIALREAGASKRQSPKENRESLRKTKAKERRGETGQARAEGKKSAGHGSRGGGAKTRTELYEEAKRRDIPGRSKMSKGQLERALNR
jgi:hypothetical protein